ncbi:MAG: c-type cytochrome [Burkholderiaceae bacterium]
MNLPKNIPTTLIATVVVIAIGIIASQFFKNDIKGTTVGVKVPQLSAQATVGKVAFDANCAKCHGANGSGTKQGPPFMNDIYNPGHHGDEAFRLAVRLGVQQHHWSYGDMLALPQVTDAQVADIVRYVRELQEVNGIFYKPHQM